MEANRQDEGHMHHHLQMKLKLLHENHRMKKSEVSLKELIGCKFLRWLIILVVAVETLSNTSSPGRFDYAA